MLSKFIQFIGAKPYRTYLFINILIFVILSFAWFNNRYQIDPESITVYILFFGIFVLCNLTLYFYFYLSSTHKDLNRKAIKKIIVRYPQLKTEYEKIESKRNITPEDLNHFFDLARDIEASKTR